MEWNPLIKVCSIIGPPLFQILFVASNPHATAHAGFLHNTVTVTSPKVDTRIYMHLPLLPLSF